MPQSFFLRIHKKTDFLRRKLNANIKTYVPVC